MHVEALASGQDVTQASADNMALAELGTRQGPIQEDAYSGLGARLPAITF